VSSEASDPSDDRRCAAVLCDRDGSVGNAPGGVRSGRCGQVGPAGPRWLPAPGRLDGCGRSGRRLPARTLPRRLLRAPRHRVHRIQRDRQCCGCRRRQRRQRRSGDHRHSRRSRDKAVGNQARRRRGGGAAQPADDGCAAHSRTDPVKPPAAAPTPAVPAVGTPAPSVVASATPPKPATPTSAAAPAAGTQIAAAVPGGVWVQVSSQKDEDGATQRRSRICRPHYAKILGGYDVNIQRADLGTRGIFFRRTGGSVLADRRQAAMRDLKSAAAIASSRLN